MSANPLLFFTFVFVPLSKIGHHNLFAHIMESYLAYPVRNPSLLISGSVVTLTSLNQWNIFDIRHITGGNVEQMMIVNALSIIQFVIGWRASAKKEKTKHDSEQDMDSKILSLQSEISTLKSKLVS